MSSIIKSFRDNAMKKPRLLKSHGVISLHGGVFVGGAGNRLRSFLFVYKKSLTVFLPSISRLV
jgi:hypothetical protein